MSKAMYYDLVKEYEDWIAGIKADQAELRQLAAAIEDAKVNDDIDALADAAEAFSFLDNESTESRAALTYRIREEYDGCPFRATRQAGIAGFWREAGLRSVG